MVIAQEIQFAYLILVVDSPTQSHFCSLFFASFVKIRIFILEIFVSVHPRYSFKKCFSQLNSSPFLWRVIIRTWPRFL